MNCRRPEHFGPAQVYYDEKQARKYSENSRIQRTLRALDLLELERPAFVADLGCGSGLSGEILDEEGHVWVGIDISPNMLAAALERDSAGDLLLADLGSGLPFRPGVFDAAVSVSALQWLANRDKSSHSPDERVSLFFTSLRSVLVNGGKAVFQFYPENDEQCAWIMAAAKTAGFGGGIVIDSPESAKQKVYLVLVLGSTPKEKRQKRKLTLKPFKYSGRKRRPRF